MARWVPIRSAALGLALVTLAASPEPYRDGLPIESYRLLGGMLAQLRNNGPLAGAGKSVDLVAPLTRALDEKHGTHVELLLRHAIDAGDRDGALVATTVLVLLDTEDLLEGVARDDYTGWTDARVRTRKAVLNYGLVADELRRLQGERDRRVVAAFGRLMTELRDSDLSTPPEAITSLSAAAVVELAAMRSAAVNARPRASDGGGAR